MNDEVILVDLDNAIIGRMDKLQAHRNPPSLHRAISIWIINDKGEVLLQKRSSKKIVGGGWWANSVCGNVRPNETFHDCAIRRLHEELGITTAVIQPVYTFAYKAYCNEEFSEYEFDQVYVSNYSGSVVPNPDEVTDYLWVSQDELFTQLSLIDTISPDQSVLMDTDELKQSCLPFKIPLLAKNEVLAVWTVFMGKDERLIKALGQIPQNSLD